MRTAHINLMAQSPLCSLAHTNPAAVYINPWRSNSLKLEAQLKNKSRIFITLSITQIPVQLSVCCPCPRRSLVSRHTGQLLLPEPPSAAGSGMIETRLCPNFVTCTPEDGWLGSSLVLITPEKSPPRKGVSEEGPRERRRGKGSRRLARLCGWVFIN